MHSRLRACDLLKRRSFGHAVAEGVTKEYEGRIKLRRGQRKGD